MATTPVTMTSHEILLYNRDPDPWLMKESPNDNWVVFHPLYLIQPTKFLEKNSATASNSKLLTVSERNPPGAVHVPKTEWLHLRSTSVVPKVSLHRKLTVWNLKIVHPED